MTNTIKSYVCTMLGGIIDIMLSEDVTNDYPYAVMELSTSEQYTKSGPYRISGTLAIHIFADDYATVSAKGDAVMTAMSAALRTVRYRGALDEQKVECNDGVWQYDLTYRVSQYNVVDDNNQTN